MPPVLRKIVGASKAEFDGFVKDGVIKLRSARLIPLINPGKEEALTSIFLSTLKLVDEFRHDILAAIGLPKSGQLFVYTEVVFPDQKDFRVDGLLLVVRGGIIKNAAILEMKNGASTLNTDQIEQYLTIAKALSIPKLITVSNEFVSEPTQSPLTLKRVPRAIDVYHLSWQFIRTLARIRLFKNDTNIADIDQVRIMEEVVAYFEHEKSGVCGLSQMKHGWKATVEKVANRTTLNKKDPELREAVESWVQEERDMALELSCKLGVLVRSGLKKYKGNNQARIEDAIDAFIERQALSSVLSVEAAVSDILVLAAFQTKTVEMSVDIIPPMDKTSKGQFGWLKRQIENRKQTAESASSMLDEICVEIFIKHARKPYRVHYKELDQHLEFCKGQEIKKFSIVLVRGFGRDFASPRKFVKKIETMLPDFYSEIVQHLQNWTKPAPKLTPVQLDPEPTPSGNQEATVVKEQF